MEFEIYSCPVCKRKFKQGDDVVVCPECGAPHHRECYQSEGHCFYKDRHAEGYTFGREEKSSESDSEKTTVCPRCNNENPATSFYCQRCGYPLLDNNGQNADSGQPGDRQYQGFPTSPFGGMPFAAAMDPMAGFKSDEPVSENVTAGELSKFVGKNTNYFMRIFRSILKFNKSRFNFAAFFVPGAYFLYRKMYAIGAVFCAVILTITVSTVFIQSSSNYTEVYKVFLDNSLNSSTATYADMLTGLSKSEALLLFAPSILELLNFAAMLIAGMTANRRYFKHCINKIRRIKADNTVTDGLTSSDERIESNGGVNLPILIVVPVVYIAIYYIPMFV